MSDRMHVHEYSVGELLFSIFVMPFFVAAVVVAVVVPTVHALDFIFNKTEFGMLVRDAFMENFFRESVDGGDPCYPISYDC